MLKVCVEYWYVDERDNTSQPGKLDEVPNHLVEEYLSKPERAFLESLQALEKNPNEQLSARNIVGFVRGFGDELRHLVPREETFQCQVDMGGAYLSHVRVEFDSAHWVPSQQKVHRVVFLRHP